MSLRTVVALSLLAASGANAAECAFRSDPEAFLERQSRHVRDVYSYARTLAVPGKTPRRVTLDASELPRRNFIDDEIFGALGKAGIPVAALSTDEEFVRRVTLDLTGRLPSPAELRAFLADESANKRDQWIDKLIGSPEFVDKWTKWWGDLLENAQFPALFDRRENGRNAYYKYIKDFVERDVSLRDVVPQLITANGNHYENGPANFSLSAKTNMGPNQDTYDNGLVKATTYFLGMSQYDCVLCHNGRGHLEQVNLWGSRATRQDAWRMAAHFSRLTMPGRNAPSTDFLFQSFDISERIAGTYDLNTTTGNRPARAAGAGGIANVTPEYRGTESKPKDGNWRAAFAESLIQDPMFATNFANRFWREFFGTGLVEPYDMLDPDRLDPDRPPPAPWTLQATHPVLLKKLAQEFRDSDLNIRHLIRVIVRSNAYRLSSRYEGKWTLDMVNLFARHYPRRLWAEEIHDIIVTGSGDLPAYTFNNKLPPVRNAMQLPDNDEPRSNGAVNGFLNAFLRGNRDSRQRTSDQTILQRMAIMNDSFVTNRTRAISPNLTALFKISGDREVVEEIYLTFLARQPSELETAAAIRYLQRALNAADRNNYLEDLVWTCINKAEFVFSY